jgi:hypothetical protein
VDESYSPHKEAITREQDHRGIARFGMRRGRH